MAWFEMLFNISGHPWDLASVCLIIILWVCFTENMGTKVSDLLRPLSCTGFTVLFFICNYCNYFFFFSFKNHQQWWQQANRAENEKGNVVESEKCYEQISSKSVEDAVVDEERRTSHPAKRRKVSLQGMVPFPFSIILNKSIFFVTWCSRFEVMQRLALCSRNVLICISSDYIRRQTIILLLLLHSTMMNNSNRFHDKQELLQ